MQNSTFQSYILTKHFPLKTRSIKKKTKQKEFTERKKALSSSEMQLISEPERCIQLYKYYVFSGLIIHDHLSIEKDGNYFGYYQALNYVKKITGVTLLEESQLLEVNFVDVKQELTPFEFFEERMKSLGNKKAFNFCETIKMCLYNFRQSQSLSRPPQPDDYEKYKKFKQSIKNKINELQTNNLCFMIIFKKTNLESPNGSLHNIQNYISYSLLKLIFNIEENFLFDLLRDGFPDWYHLEGEYYEQMTNLFQTLFLRAPNELRIILKGKNGEIYRGGLECQTLGFQAEKYQEYAVFHILNIEQKNKIKMIMNKSGIKLDYPTNLKVEEEKETKLKRTTEKKLNSVTGRIHEYLFHSEQFNNQFYQKKVPLNCLEENKDNVCKFRLI